MTINNFKDNNDIWLKTFTLIIIIVSCIGFIFSLIVYLVELYDNGTSSICLSKDCYQNMVSRFSASIDIAKQTITLLVSVSAIGGIIIAVKNYVKSSYALAISNHISNFRIFSDFINYEISKRNRINPTSVSSFYWYNKLFPNSRQGDVQISQTYENVISAINLVIKNSNEVFTSSTRPDFSYNTHQSKMISALSNVGIKICNMGRNDFFMAEGEILHLIEVVNIEFCGLNDEKYKFEKRIYI